MKKFFKEIRYLSEALTVFIGIGFFRIIGAKNASDLGSFLSRKIGKIHYSNNLAKKNMKKALPDLTDFEIEKNLENMWDNLGRIIGEFAYLSKESPRNMVKKYVVMEKEVQENIEFIKNSKKKGGIFFSAHIGNWEMGPKFFINHGFETSTVYRPLNNPYVEKITAKIRGVDLIPKSAKGNRKIIEKIKNGKYVLIMADQKISEGEPIKFFHEDAITTTSLARMALKYDIDLIPVCSVRIGKEFKFKANVEKPIIFEKSADFEQDVLDLTRIINKHIENWIRSNVSQWFWVHNRWKK